MRTRLIAGMLLLATVGALPADAGVATKLTLASRTPLTVRGTGFKPSERVVVTAMTLSGARRVAVVASPLGRFSATIRTANQPCGRPFAVRAVGGKGSFAIMRLNGAACVPPPIN